MATLTVSAADEKRVKAMGFLSNKGTDNFSGRIITVNGKITAAQLDQNEEDVYVVDEDFRWTYVHTHEDGWCGPYFCRNNESKGDG